MIYTDSGCDIAKQDLQSWGVGYCDMSYMFNGSDRQYGNFDLPADEFYRRIKAGGTAKTAAVNQMTYETEFSKAMEAGRDVLYLCFSSGLSSSCNTARLAAEDLAEQYPDRKILIVDTLCASAGHGMLVYLAVQKRDAGWPLEEIAAYLEKTRLRVCSWFTVDDLKHLASGGRLSAAAATVGSLIGIKPVLHMDNDGHLIFRYIVRGRKAAIKALAEEVKKRSIDFAGGIWFVSNADCPEAAQKLEELIVAAGGPKAAYIADIGPVVGSHCGPGTLSVFFLGNER